MFSPKESGSALVGVLGVMGVTTVIALTITTMSFHAVGYTTATRAGVQAEAAAEAGIDFAAANLATAVCQPQYSNTSAPVFAVTVAYSTLPTSPGDVDTSWVSGCPTWTDAKRLKLVSTGRASSLGVAGSSSGNVRKVEAIFPYTPSPFVHGINPSGAAIYAAAQADPIISNMTITQASTAKPIIEYLSGSATCTSGSSIMGDMVLGAGALAVTSGCTINGDLYASNVVSIQSGEVTGDVNAAGVQSGISVSLSNSAIVGGDIFAAGPISISGKVTGNITAGPIGGLSTFSSKSSVGGSVDLAGTISNNGAITGLVETNDPGIVTPKIPIVPPWIDFAYNPDDWQTPTGTPFSVLKMTTCSSSAIASALITVQNSLVPIILDTRVCGADTNLGSNNLILKSDAVIIANGLRLGGNDFESSDSTDKRLWLIVPDAVADKQPTCPANSVTKIVSNVLVGPHVGSMIYSPCPISNATNMWRGQMYASSISTSAGFTLNYLPLGLPTVDLGTGGSNPPPGTGVLGDRTSIRDLVVD